jgi:hypothetical protein
MLAFNFLSIFTDYLHSIKEIITHECKKKKKKIGYEESTEKYMKQECMKELTSFDELRKTVASWE